jgi:hypothetical protein
MTEIRFHLKTFPRIRRSIIDDNTIAQAAHIKIGHTISKELGGCILAGHRRDWMQHGPSSRGIGKR